MNESDDECDDSEDPDEVVRNKRPMYPMPRWPQAKMKKIIKMLLPLLLYLQASTVIDQHCDMVNLEVFCGVRSICDSFQSLGLPSIGFDVCDSDQRDILKPQGLHKSTCYIKLQIFKNASAIPKCAQCVCSMGGVT